MLKDFIILIPARIDSTRFYAKPLALIKGKPMICHVYENAMKSGIKTVVATNSHEIADTLSKIGGESVIIDDDVNTGTDRIFLAYQRYFNEFEYVINLQGDEPLVSGKALRDLANFHSKSSFDIATMLVKRDDLEGYLDPDTVKVIYLKDGSTIYFSRSPIPYNRAKDNPFYWYQHLGVYCYKKDALLRFSKLAGEYARLESLEQLRALENGLTIGGILVEGTFISVDNPSDIVKIEKLSL